MAAKKKKSSSRSDVVLINNIPYTKKAAARHKQFLKDFASGKIKPLTKWPSSTETDG